MSHDERRKFLERTAFEHFCAVEQFEFDSLLQPEPNAPDIVAEIRGAGKVGFELVDLNDGDYLREENTRPEAQLLVTGFHQEMQPEQKARFDSKLGDAWITVHFDAAYGKPGVKRTLGPFFQALSDLPDRFAGQPFHKNTKDRLEGIEFAFISRIMSLKGPEFRATSSGYVVPLDLARLEKKLDTKYVCDAPVELLAYATEIRHDNDDQAIPRIVIPLLPESAYRRVWIFQTLLGQVQCFDRAQIA